jgi:hypothetical protein
MAWSLTRGGQWERSTIIESKKTTTYCKRQNVGLSLGSVFLVSSDPGPLGADGGTKLGITEGLAFSALFLLDALKPLSLQEHTDKKRLVAVRIVIWIFCIGNFTALSFRHKITDLIQRKSGLYETTVSIGLFSEDSH